MSFVLGDGSTLTSGAATDGTPVTIDTLSISPAPNALLIATVALNAGGTVSSVTGCGLTWVNISSLLRGSGRLSVWRAMGPAPTAGVVTFTATVAQTSRNWGVTQITGVDTSGTNGSGAIVKTATSTISTATSQTADLTPVAAGNGTLGISYVGTTTAITPGVNFTELVDISTTLPGNSLGIQWAFGGDPTVDATWASANSVMLGIEIKAAPGAVLVPSSLTHSHTLSSPTLVQHQVLSANNLSHAHTLSSPALVQHHVLEPDDLIHQHTLSSPTLTQHHVLEPDNLLHDHELSSPTLTQHHVLEVDDLLHDHELSSPTLIQHQVLEPNDLMHDHALSSPALTQHHVLDPDDLLHTHTLESPTFSSSGATVLVPQSLLHGHTLSSVTLVPHNPEIEPPEGQVYVVPHEDRTDDISSENRTLRVPAENRTLIVPPDPD